MARRSAPMPPWTWVPIALGAVAAVLWALAGTQLTTGRSGSPAPGAVAALPGPATTAAPAPRSEVPSTAAAPAAPGRPIPVTTESLGRTQIGRFAFDRAVPGRVVACEAESLDGGRTWRRLGEAPADRAIVLGGRRAATPAAGPHGRILCGDAILPAGGGLPVRVGDVQTAIEWTGTGWRPAGLPVAAPAPGDTTLDVAVAYVANGGAVAVRPDRLLTADQQVELPGRVSAFAFDGQGALYAAVAAPARRPHLMWTAASHEPWRDVPTPGEPRAIVASGERVWVAAEMLGRGARDRWDWTRWPPHVSVDGIDAVGSTVVGWGAHGALVVSRDGGATLGRAPLGSIPVWAAVDPHAPQTILVLDGEGGLTRVRLP